MYLFSFIGLVFLALLAAIIAHLAGIAKFLKAFTIVILGAFLFIILVQVLRPLWTKMVLDKEDYYGEYIINRNFYPGEQADWQYNTFRFEIRNNDSIYFYITDKQKVLDTFTGRVKFRKPYNSVRISINMNQPTHHVLSYNPTTYRKVWHFNLIFESPKFYNVCFTKGKWQPLE